MTTDQYLKCYSQYFWVWDSNGETIALQNRNTIAYTRFVAEILNIIGLNGAPRFGTLLMALAVTDHYNGEQNFNQLKQIFQELLPSNDTNSGLEFLQELLKLPTVYKTGKNRQLLLNALFWKSHNGVSFKIAKKAANKLNEIANANEYVEIAFDGFNTTDVYNDILVFELLKRKFKNGQGLLDAMANLPENLPEIEIEDRPVQSSRKEKEQAEPFLESLCNDYKTYKIGNLIRSIWSGLNIPYHSIQPSAQPLGGVADISNKGEFHQLLISEFANDDFTFLSRLANNEALYLERETPPENNPYERVFLIDTSLRNWGNPKTVALAISIAIAQHPKNQYKCSTIILNQEAKVYQLNSIKEVINAQSELSPNIHSAQEIEDYFKAYNKTIKRQIFYIGAKDGLRHEAINRALANNRQYIDYKIILDQEGGVSIYKTQGISQRHVQDFKLNLNKHWEKTPSLKPKSHGQTELNITDIEDLKSPLLIDVSRYSTQWAFTEDGKYFQFSKNQVYLHNGEIYKMWQKGFEYIGEKPKTDIFEIGITSANEIVLLSYFQNNNKIIIKNYTTNKSVDLIFPHTIPIRYASDAPLGLFVFYNDAFYTSGKNCWRIALDGSIRPDKNFKLSLLPNRLEFYKNSNQQLHIRHTSVLKNLNKLYINQRKNLVFNNHELIFSTNGVIKFKGIELNNAFKTALAEASQKKPNHFQFANGFQVLLHNSGLAICQAPKKQILFFFPTTLDQSIAVGTNEYFVGNKYFLKVKGYYLKFWLKPNASKLEVIKAYREITKEDLGEAKMKVEFNENRILLKDYNSAEEMLKLITPYCKSVKIEDSLHDQKIITTQQFHKRFIAPAIQDIIDHETKA